MKDSKKKLPEQLLQSLEHVPGFNRESFVAVHEKDGGVTSVRTNPAKLSFHTAEHSAPEQNQALQHSSPVLSVKRSEVPWSQYGYYLEQRPSFTFDPLFHAGCYYVQEASSMFLEQVLVQLADLSKPLKVVDLCAAPGGKSTHMQSLLSKDSLLVSNETIKPRSIVLTDNIVKWGEPNVLVTNNDPKAYQQFPGYFDVMVVDAPCSGSGLFRKDNDAIDEWSLHNVNLCHQRQQRILSDALPALKEGGLLIYSTCSYSAEENEEIMEWLSQKMEMENLPLRINPDWGIVATRSERSGSEGYRFYPDQVKGEGFFLACFRKKSAEGSLRTKIGKLDSLSARDKNIVSGWVKEEDLAFIRFRNTLTAIPQHVLTELAFLQNGLNIQYAGVALGEIFKEKLVPHHALAQSSLLSPAVQKTNLTYENAIKYLQRQDLAVEPETQGWQVVQYMGKPLGWINALKNRVNNYYPKEIRILRQNQ